MCKVCIFAGTTEGRKLAGALAERGAEVTVCTATEYGGSLLPPGVEVRAGRLDQAGMETLFSAEKFSRVVDATHPYAAEVTKNIRAACEAVRVPYLRLLRGEDAPPGGAAVFPDVPQAVEYLSGTEGNILLVTGSRDLKAWSALPDFSRRVYARVLPVETSLAACREVHLAPDHILAMQGPFSTELNGALLQAVGAKFLVTKSDGAPGGFAEKAEGAARAGAELIVLGRPVREEGFAYREVLSRLCRELGLSVTPKVSVIGAGPGTKAGMTVRAREALEGAECVIGAKRLLALASPGQIPWEAVSPEKILEGIRAHPECGRFAVVLSGDVGLFSGARRLLPMLEGCQVEVYPGVSSLAYLCARLGTSYEDVTPVSLHGRDRDIVSDVNRCRRVFALVGGEGGVRKLCAALVDGGLGEAKVSVGERLAYPDEKVTAGTAAALAERDFHPLSAVLIEGGVSQIVTPGLPDGQFIRGESVPMTKSEVRAVILSKLALPEDAVCWDVGAGTGSVSVELARLARRGRVHAVERRPEALALLERNREKFRLENLDLVPGEAPEALRGLPAPTHVFLGGGGREAEAVLTLALEKNPRVRAVASAVTLETVSALTRCGETLPWTEWDAVCLTVSRSRRAGRSTLMEGQNPVYLFTFQG